MLIRKIVERLLRCEIHFFFFFFLFFFFFFFWLDCIEIPINGGESEFSSEEFFRSNNITVSGISLVESTLLFSIKAIHFKPNGPLNSPDCYFFDLKLLFDNQGCCNVPYLLSQVITIFFNIH